jgi:hypothetical protein
MASSGADALNAELQRLLRLHADNDNAQKLIDDAQIWLADPVNAASITDDIAADVIANIGDAQSAIGDARRLGQLDQAQIDAVISSVTAAANAAGLKFEVTVISGINMIFALKDADGNDISRVTTGNPIKQTGTDAATLLAIVLAASVLFAAAVIGSVLIIRKRRIIKA